jgi:hypothetical protein
MSDIAQAQLSALVTDLAQAEGGQLPVDALAARARAHGAALRAALPDRFGRVLDDLLTRLESAASFTEEACAVSQRDLLASLRLWTDQAKARLEAG